MQDSKQDLYTFERVIVELNNTLTFFSLSKKLKHSSLRS